MQFSTNLVSKISKLKFCHRLDVQLGEVCKLIKELNQKVTSAITHPPELVSLVGQQLCGIRVSFIPIQAINVGKQTRAFHSKMVSGFKIHFQFFRIW
jgi:hypothetical protein